MDSITGTPWEVTFRIMIHKWVLHTSVWLYFDNCSFWLELLRAFQVSRLPRILTVDWLKHFLWCKNGAVGWQSLLLLRWRSPPCRFDPFESLSRSCSPLSNWNGFVSPKLRHPQIRPSRLCLPCWAWALSQLWLKTRQWHADVHLPVVSRDKSIHLCGVWTQILVQWHSPFSDPLPRHLACFCANELPFRN